MRIDFRSSDSQNPPNFNVDFVECPSVQMLSPKEIAFNLEESKIISSELDKPLTKRVIVKSQHCHGEFLSSIHCICSQREDWRV